MKIYPNGNCDFGIDRMLLRAALGVQDKMPVEFHGTFENMPAYDWIMGDKRVWARFNILVKTTEEAQPTRAMVRHLAPNLPYGFFGKPAKSSAHRVFVLCTCGKEIPAGRYHQHAPACKNPVPPPANPLTVFEDRRSWDFINASSAARQSGGGELSNFYKVFADWCMERNYQADAKWLLDNAAQVETAIMKQSKC